MPPTEPTFVLQDLLAAALSDAAGNHPEAIQFTDDCIQPYILVGSPNPLRHIVRTLLTQVFQSGRGGRLDIRPLLRLGSEVLIEFTIAHRKDLQDASPQAPTTAETEAIDQAEVAIQELGGRSERIQLHGAATGLKFILKWRIAQQSGRFKETETQFANKRVLVAEDNEVNGEGLCQLLRSYGLEPDLVPGGKEAIDALTRKAPYDLLLLDLHMPHMDGFEVANYIRKKLKSNIPIIGLSAVALPANQSFCATNGLSHCLLKSTATATLQGLFVPYLGNQISVQRAKAPVVNRGLWRKAGEYRITEPYKHSTLVHQHRPAL